MGNDQAPLDPGAAEVALSITHVALAGSAWALPGCGRQPAVTSAGGPVTDLVWLVMSLFFDWTCTVIVYVIPGVELITPPYVLVPIWP